jgi:pimeloyl-ACP methyl ester carboxylesterase
MDRHHPPAPTALVDLGVSIIGRALTAFRRDAIDAAVAEASAVGARCAKVEMTPGVWQLRLSHRDDVAELSLVGDGAPAGVVGRWYMARPGRQGPRPVVVVVHGYNAGDYLIEERLWPRALLAEQGIDVLLFVMPDHGVRKSGFGLPPWPNPEDLEITARRIDQAVRELRGLIDALKRDAQVIDIAVWGMSLGSYVGAMAAAAHDVAAFAGITPLMSLPEFFREHGIVDYAGADALDAVFGARSPWSMSLSCPAVVVHAEGDGVTGRAQAHAMARWAQAKIVRIEGSHLAPLGLSDAFDFVSAETVAAFRARGAKAP